MRCTGAIVVAAARTACLVSTLLSVLGCGAEGSSSGVTAPALGGGAGAGPSNAGGGGAPSDDDARFWPRDLQVSALPGGRGVFALTALTVRRRGNATEAFATVLNDGDVPACSGSMTIQFFDRDDNPIDIGIGALLTQHFYRRTDGSDAIAACVGPGDVSVVAITDLDAALVIEDIRAAVYRTTYFALDVVPLSGGLSIAQVRPIGSGGETSYVGTLANELGFPVYGPTATVYPVNHAGRVLGRAVASSSLEIAAGGVWTFATDSIPTTPAIDAYAFPTARFTP